MLLKILAALASSFRRAHHTPDPPSLIQPVMIPCLHAVLRVFLRETFVYIVRFYFLHYAASGVMVFLSDRYS